MQKYIVAIILLFIHHTGTAQELPVYQQKLIERSD